MIGNILSLLKYWKAGGIVIVAIFILTNIYLAHSRGEKLQALKTELKAEQTRFQTQIKQIEKIRQDEKERHDFRTKQNKKIKVAGSVPLELNGDLRAAYNGLRNRQAQALTQ